MLHSPGRENSSSGRMITPARQVVKMNVDRQPK
jgi:hypothetical protein